MLNRMIALAIAAFMWGAGEVRAATASFGLADGRTLVTNCSVMEILGTQKVVLTGSPARIKLFEKGGTLVFDSSADRIVITPSGASEDKALSGIKTAELTGSVNFTYESTDAATGKRLKTAASSDSASYESDSDTIYLKRNVKVQIEDPTRFEGPGEMTGDEAMIRLGKEIGPDDVRFRISSSPGVSTIRATPRSEEDTESAR